jgi:hypothetical protein
MVNHQGSRVRSDDGSVILTDVSADVGDDMVTMCPSGPVTWGGRLNPPNNAGLVSGQRYLLELPRHLPGWIRVNSAPNPVDRVVEFEGVDSPPMCSRVAIILRGPPGAGKSRVATLIQERCSWVRHVTLDDGWGPGEFRYRGGRLRYQDLAHAAEQVLLVELGWGEPLDQSSPGATTNPDEWYKVLLNAGRFVRPFLFCADEETARSNIRDRMRREGRPSWVEEREMQVWRNYEARHPQFTFPPPEDYAEETVIVGGSSYEEIAEEVMRRSSLR